MRFEERFGHCKVPLGWREHTSLGYWTARQRRHRREGRLSAIRIRKFDALGFEWSGGQDTSWDEMFARLVQFKERFGHCEVQLGWQEDFPLVLWVRTQRQSKKRGRLSGEQIRRLENIGFEWKPDMPEKGPEVKEQSLES